MTGAVIFDKDLYWLEHLNTMNKITFQRDTGDKILALFLTSYGVLF